MFVESSGKLGSQLFRSIFGERKATLLRGKELLARGEGQLQTWPVVMADGIDDTAVAPVMTATLALPPAAAVLASGTPLPPILLPPPLPLLQTTSIA